VTTQLQLLDDLLMAGRWTDTQLVLITQMRLDVLADKSMLESLKATQASLLDDMKALLPAAVPVDDTRRRHIKKIEHPCPSCMAPKGKPCLLMTHGGGKASTVLDPPQTKVGYHAQRGVK